MRLGYNPAYTTVSYQLIAASMRPRRMRLGYAITLAGEAGEELASMRPRRMRLGYCCAK